MASRSHHIHVHVHVSVQPSILPGPTDKGLSIQRHNDHLRETALTWINMPSPLLMGEGDYTPSSVRSDPCGTVPSSSAEQQQPSQGTSTPPPLTAEDNISMPQLQPTRQYPNRIQKPSDRLSYTPSSC